MSRDKSTAISLPFAHASHGPMALHCFEWSRIIDSTLSLFHFPLLLSTEVDIRGVHVAMLHVAKRFC